MEQPDIRMLGKRPARHDPRTLQLAKYLTQTLPPPPEQVDYGSKVPADGWGMMLNDKIGDCTCAAAGHLIMDWSSNAAGLVSPPDPAILAAYEAVSGYNPTTGSSDNGAVEIDVLNYWKTNGIAGNSIIAYVAIEPKNAIQMKDAVSLFGGCYVGLALPVSAQNQTVWSVPTTGPVGPGAPGSWGGHAVPIVGYDIRGLTCITWGSPLLMTWQFWATYGDEAYAILDSLFFNEEKAPNGFDLATLRADLAVIPQALALTPAK